MWTMMMPRFGGIEQQGEGDDKRDCATTWYALQTQHTRSLWLKSQFTDALTIIWAIHVQSRVTLDL